MSAATPSVMTPREIVHELDKHIVGQQAAKRAVAIALRNRWRRMQLGDALREEVTPKNILMIGPTGVGKTEIARRLAKLAGAPFIKVEATKFTEVGYVGRDVESIIRDLADAAVKMLRQEQIEIIAAIGEVHAELPRHRGEVPQGEVPVDAGEGERFPRAVDAAVRPHVGERLRLLRGVGLVGVPGAARHLRRPQHEPVLSLGDLDLRLLLVALEGAGEDARRAA